MTVRLKKGFFHREVDVTARDLVGKILVHRLPDGTLLKERIAETEAYGGEEDLACHASKGRTKRTEILYGESGVIYVYLCYGMHWMMNVVTGEKDHPQGVLIRAGKEHYGPAKLTKYLQIDGSFNGQDICSSPDMLGGSRFSKKVANFVIRRCTDYVLLTEEMNRVVNPSGKPHVILEGHADISMKDRVPSRDQKVKPRICMYAGGVSRRYGLHLLVEGFQKANISDTRLEIYGPGDYVKELEAIAAEDPRVFYGGMLLNSEIVEKEQCASLLVNPRPTHEEYVKYSFPSKTMEYMASGTPVLMTRLPGMPKEYAPYVFFIQEETVDGVARALEQVLSLSDEELFARGTQAREFVLTQRNNVVQAQKILDMLK